MPPAQRRPQALQRTWLGGRGNGHLGLSLRAGGLLGPSPALEAGERFPWPGPGLSCTPLSIVEPGKGSQTLISVPPLKGYRQKDYFIATQGPLAHTVEDFWRMVWEWKCHTVVMLTEVQEREQVRDARHPAPCGGLPRTHGAPGGPPPPTGPTPWQLSAAEATGTGEGARLEMKEVPLLLSHDRPLAFALSRHFISPILTVFKT